ncbi:SDR family oxidoreductase [Solibacillus sp. FSL W7-1472]|uniref:SDR family NAD(P)-dependent oxidoreductase n=1 Tax=Solibacillus sp. FSL W7-1472 TaxID=2921707 RepID=UPI0030DD96A3
MKLQNKVAIVTGSTSGIGKYASFALAKAGARVTVTGRRSEKGEQVVQEIKANGGQAIFVQADMMHEESYEYLVNETLQAFGQIDILVNNAGNIIEKSFLELTIDDFQQFITLDGYAYFRMMQEVIPHMKNGGSIINVTSLAAINTIPTHSLYSFVKAGVTQMSKGVAQEFAGQNIRVNCLLPGAVDTEMVAGNPNSDFIRSLIPMQRFSTPEEQANIIVFLASDDSSYMTGTSIVADGGVRGI